MPNPGRLVLVCTPIGNLGDLSPRAAEALSLADFWLVEDTRVSGKLQAHWGLKKPMRVLNEHTTPAARGKFLDEVEAGACAALLTDAGAPTISDPGALLVDESWSRSIEVDAIPGPSAVIDALMLSGFFAQQFSFLGFLPRKPGPAFKELSAFADSTHTLVLFESPFRTEKILSVAYEALGERRYAVCRELTKLHQQVYRNTLPALPKTGEVPAKGEFVIVVEGKRRKRNEGK